MPPKTSQHSKIVSRHVFKKNSATGETSQAIASLTNFTSFAFMTRLLSSQTTLSLDNFYHQTRQLLSPDNFYHKITFTTFNESHPAFVELSTKVILLSESSWRECFRRTCFLRIVSATIDMVNLKWHTGHVLLKSQDW